MLSHLFSVIKEKNLDVHERAYANFLSNLIVICNIKAAEDCIAERPRSRNGVASRETLENIEDSPAASLAGDLD